MDLNLLLRGRSCANHMNLDVTTQLKSKVISEPEWAQSRWYAAYTRARHEKSVARQMEGRGIECLLPVYRENRRWKDRRKLLDFPLFPGYVFLQISLAGAGARLASTGSRKPGEL